VLTPLPFHWGLVQFLLVKISVVRVRSLSAVCPQRTGGASVTIIELPQAQRYRRTFAELQTRCPALVPVERWQQAVADAKRFLAKWGEQAESLGWSSADLFGLHTEPAKPHPSYNRLRRWGRLATAWMSVINDLQLLSKFDFHHAFGVPLSRFDDAQLLVSARKALERAKLVDRCGRNAHPLCYLHLHVIWKVLNHIAQFLYGRHNICCEAHG
jgi:hypothetical protein